MATRTATIQSVEILRGDDDQNGTTSRTRRVVVGLVNLSGNTVVGGGTDTLRIANVGTAIADFTSDGLVYTLRAACLYANARQSGVSFFGTLALSGNQVDVSPVAVSDYSSAATLASSAGEAPYQIMCFCTVA